MTLAAVSFDWSVNRAAGIAAMLLASVSVAAGVLSARGPGLGRAVLRRPLPDGRGLHEALSLATLAAIAVHVVAFAGDGFFAPGVVGTLVPFASPYRAFATGVGQVAAYGLAALGLAYYARTRIGPARWRATHRWIVAFWALSVLHTFLAGSDVSRAWFALAMVPPVVAVLIALGLHWLERVDAATSS
jgi:methionine sulfoxide reductase heme-binding subunit